MALNLTRVSCSEIPPAHPSHKRVLFFSDVHLMHGQTPTFVIIYNLMIMIMACLQSRVDAIYILGDLFDERDTLDSDGAQIAIEFLNDLLWLCKERNIALRVLEGTPKHDRKQSKTLVRLNKKVGVDLKYFDDITVFYDEKIEKSVGLIPDEYRTNAKETTKLFKNLMKANGYEKLDLMGMHGMFHFQIPHIQSEANFDQDVFQRMVKYMIAIGHDHNEKKYGIIRVLGSPDCLSHGETGIKGVTLVDFKEDDAEAYFVMNPHPCPYYTVNGEGRDDESIIKEVEEKVRLLKEHKHGKHGKLRVTYPHDSDIRVMIRTLSEQHGIPIKASRLANKEKWVKISEAFGKRSEGEVHLDTATITRLLRDRIKVSGPKVDSIFAEVESRL